MNAKKSMKENSTVDFAHDLGMFGSSISVGLSLEDAFGYLSENGSDLFAPAWYSLWLRLQNGVVLELAMQDFKTICKNRNVDHFCELVIACETYNAAVLAHYVDQYAKYLQSLGQVEYEASRRIRSVGSVSWLSLSAPWIMLIILFFKPENRVAFLDSVGVAIILFGVLSSLLAMYFSRAIASTPALPRPFS